MADVVYVSTLSNGSRKMLAMWANKKLPGFLPEVNLKEWVQFCQVWIRHLIQDSKLLIEVILYKSGHRYNGTTFIFCQVDCPFESEPSPIYADACGEVTSCAAGHQEVACVAPEVDLRECTLHSPPQKTFVQSHGVKQVLLITINTEWAYVCLSVCLFLSLIITAASVCQTELTSSRGM